MALAEREAKQPSHADDRKREAAPVRRLAAEVVGTFFLVPQLRGPTWWPTSTPASSPTAVRAIAPALVVAAMIYAVGSVSGAHFNPAVTVAFAGAISLSLAMGPRVRRRRAHRRRRGGRDSPAWSSTRSGTRGRPTRKAPPDRASAWRSS